MINPERLKMLEKMYQGLREGNYNVCERSVANALARLQRYSLTEDEAVIKQEDLRVWGTWLIQYLVNEATALHPDGFDPESMTKPADPAELQKLLEPLAALFAE